MAINVFVFYLDTQTDIDEVVKFDAITRRDAKQNLVIDAVTETIT